MERKDSGNFLSAHKESAEQFFRNNPPPSVHEVSSALAEFVKYQVEQKRKVALVTSGGTTVPLEKNTVRYLDNFSGGGRGSASAEYFIERGYGVIFLYRRHSLQPYGRHFLVHQANNFLDYLETNEKGVVEVVPSFQAKVAHILEKHSKATTEKRLLKIQFTSVHEYLFLLRETSKAISSCGHDALIFSAAAVSDFYIPTSVMVEHKIQSSEGPLTITFQPVPKMLGILRREWTPEAFVVSFKLETDTNMLSKKAETSLKSYKQQMVVGNLLANHKDSVIIYSPNTPPVTLKRTAEEVEKDVDIEKKIIDVVIERHQAFLSAKSN